MDRIRVAINGYGVIGKLVADAVRLQDDMALAGVADVVDDYRLQVAARAGLPVHAATPQAERSMRAAGIAIAGGLAELLEKSDVVVDCTPKKVAAVNKGVYEAAGVKAIFHGGESHALTSHSFVALANYASALGRSSMRVMSCNTTSIVRTLGALRTACLLKRACGTGGRSIRPCDGLGQIARTTTGARTKVGRRIAGRLRRAHADPGGPLVEPRQASRCRRRQDRRSSLAAAVIAPRPNRPRSSLNGAMRAAKSSDACHKHLSSMYALSKSVLSVAALLLSGCASMAPPYEAPALPTASGYSIEYAQAGARAAEIGWRGYFTDPRLQTLISLALENNRDLRTAVLRVQEARAVHGIQRAEQFPTVGAQAGLERARVPADLNLTGRQLLSSQYQVGLGLATWEIDFWGRVRSLQDAVLEDFLATEAARRAFTVGLVAQIADSDFILRELDERLVLARRTIASREETVRIVSRRVEVGSTSRLTLTQVQTLLTQAQALGAQLEQARGAQLHALTLLVGVPVDLPPAHGLLDEQHALRELSPGLPSELLIQRPDIVAAEHQLRAANANIGAARAAFFPRVALTGSLGTGSAELDGLFASGSHAWTFSPSISLPLFDAGRRRNNLSLAEARRDLALAHYEKTVQGAFRDVSDALSARRWLTEQVAIARAALAAQFERARLSQLRYDSGAAAFLEVLDAQRDLLSAEQQLVQTRRALLSSRVSLYAALGGGSLHPLVADTPSARTPETIRTTERLQ